MKAMQFFSSFPWYPIAAMAVGIAIYMSMALYSDWRRKAAALPSRNLIVRRLGAGDFSR
jgi:hypothetical protein